MELPHPTKAARQAGLHYVADSQPGIRRVKSGKGFRYIQSNGKPLRERRQLARIKALVIPPAWKNVWICPRANGHLQATGVDARGRKQYRYHSAWTATRNRVKFNSMLEFSAALPQIRKRVQRDLRKRGMSKDRVIACVVRLMDTSLIRVGSDEYARDNESFGLTTIRRNHVRVNGSGIKFSFKGKSGQKVETTIHDPRAAKVVRQCQELPGQEVFEYVDEQGRNRDVRSEHVNEYLTEVTGKELTAKDFRTWAGTVVAAQSLIQCGPCTIKRRNGSKKRISEGEFKRRCVASIKAAAEALGNRVATCRKFYVHPKLAECYADGRLERAFRAASRDRSPAQLCKQERAIARLLKMIDT